MKDKKAIEIINYYTHHHGLSREAFKVILELKHFKDSSIGLWCTDKPEIIPKDKKHSFFQLK